MKLKLISVAVLALLLISTISIINVQSLTEYEGTIYIRSNGAVDPPSAPISVNGITYTLNSDVYGTIVIQKDGITLDGASHTIQGKSTYQVGISVLYRTGVIVKNFIIHQYGDTGIDVGLSSQCTITNNVISGNYLRGILFYESSNNYVIGNTIIDTVWDGIFLHVSSNNNIIQGNDIERNTVEGIANGWTCENTIIYENNIKDNNIGIAIGDDPSATLIYHNNFIGNTIQFTASGILNHVLDNGYPSGGNYWSDYAGVDVKQGSAQNIKGRDMIGDIPYVIDTLNVDHYPLMTPWTPLPSSIRGLITEVNQLSSKGQFTNKLVTSALLVNLNVAQRFLDRGKLNDAKVALKVFKTIVQKLPNSQITPTARYLLIQSTENVISNL